MTEVLGWFFACAALGAFLILCALVLHAVPRILATLGPPAATWTFRSLIRPSATSNSTHPIRAIRPPQLSAVSNQQSACR